MKYYAFLIQALTNMHVGSGDASYGIVDKLVQRDPVTKFPTINASGLKGALREHFTNNGMEKKIVDEIFGKKASGNNDNTEPGSHSFLGADLVALPVRSTEGQFVWVLNLTNLKRLNDKAIKLKIGNIFNINDNMENKLFYKNAKPPVYLEEKEFNNGQIDANPTSIVIGNDDILTDKYWFAPDKDFLDLAENLPVIARNHLESGISKNLWYEEIVPHQSIFLTFIGAPENSQLLNILDEEIIQIGANATIGYGLCKFYLLTKQKNDSNEN